MKGIFRPWAERLDMSLPTLDSNEDDPELLIHVPFNGSVKIKVGLHLHTPSYCKGFSMGQELSQLPPCSQGPTAIVMSNSVPTITASITVCRCHRRCKLVKKVSYAGDHHHWRIRWHSAC